MKCLQQCKTLQEEQSGSSSSNFVKQNIDKEKCFEIDYQQWKPFYY